MNKIKFIFVCLLFVLFIPDVYAFGYDMNMSVGTTNVKIGETKVIKVSLKNIQGTNDGIFVCSLNISSSNNIEIGNIRTLNNWSLTVGDIYLFSTGSPVLNDSEIFVIPVKVNGEGYVEIKNIMCSDSVEEIGIDNKKINFTIKKETESAGNNKPNTDNKPTTEEVKDEKSSNCNIASLELSDGTIDFDPNITEYSISVDDFDKLKINLTLESNLATYIINRNNYGDKKNIVITVSAEDNSQKKYTIFVEEKTTNIPVEKKPENKNYTIIFIVIIGILLLLNVYRIIRNRKK